MARPEAFVLLLVTILYQTGCVCSQTNTSGIFASRNPIPVGSEVTLFSTSIITTGVWLFNTEIILIIVAGNSQIAKKWASRITFNSTTSSLTIRSLTVNDSGVYALSAFDSSTSQLDLSVRVPISNVILRAEATDLVEFNDSAVFSCSIAAGSLPSYVWLNGSSELADGGNIRLSTGNTSLTIVNVTRYDSGPFTCNVSNGISHEASRSVLLNISYGPSNTEILVEPVAPNKIYRAGSDISLSCSVQSRPPASIRWMVNDTLLNSTGTLLQLKNVTVKDSATYKCIFHNSATLRFSSASVTVSVMNPLEAAVLRSSNELAIANTSFLLHCDVTGTVESYKWWKDGQHIPNENRTLAFDPVLPSDTGIYQCQATNAVSNVTSRTLELQVNFGPETPTIEGPDAVVTGTNVSLACNASSFPRSTYRWFFNGSLVANTSTYVTPPLTTQFTWTFTCVAFNDITGLNSTADKKITVIERITGVEIKASDKLPIEGFPYTLTCSVSGPVDHVDWALDGRPVMRDNTIELLKNAITFQPLEQNDTGTYKCVAVNAAENVTSNSYTLNVNFGPDTPVIIGPDVVEIEESAVFSCSAASEPPSEMSWWFNGTLLSNTSVVVIDHVPFNMSGNYTCKAFNNVTGISSTNTLDLKVIGNLTVVIKNDTNPINSNNLTLTCDVTGPYDAIHWTKDNQTLGTSLSPRNVSYHIGKNTLSFSPVTTSDDGVYQCVAVNVVTQQQSRPYHLLVNYGPNNVTITGPDSAPQNSLVTLTCSANSRPTPDFQWVFIGGSNSSAVNATGPVLNFTATPDNQGNYTCKARNPVTNITMSTTRDFTVTVGGHASTFHLATHSGLMLAFSLSLLVLLN